jgi:ketosteroid isomerase-like protein
MSAEVQLLEKFYVSFQRKDYASMIACYHPQVTFSDPVFTDLKGKQASAMWHMLCERAKDFSLEFRDIHAHGDHAHVHWEATYTFTSTGRHVHNIIDATFAFQDGKIIRHLDSFDLWRWTRMALGISGVLLGWSPMVQNKVRATAHKGLMVFIDKHPEYQ